jgi:hypothetical protein
MKCHGDNKENNKGHKYSPLKHMLHMVLCCGLPIVIVGFLPLITKVSPSAAGFVGKIVPFICPLIMVGMMFSMMGMGKNKEKSCCSNSNEESNTKEIV